MTRNLTITANSKIVNVRIWINPVTNKIVFQLSRSDTDTSKNSINGVETTVRDGRGSNMTLDAHSFELVFQKKSLSTDDFTIIPRKSKMSITLRWWKCSRRSQERHTLTSSITSIGDTLQVEGE